jgi:hypothetical protein
MVANVDLPGATNGYEIARHVHERWPGIEILITSGRLWPEFGDMPLGAAFIPKPYPNDALLKHKSAVARQGEADRAGLRTEAAGRYRHQRPDGGEGAGRATRIALLGRQPLSEGRTRACQASSSMLATSFGSQRNGVAAVRSRRALTWLPNC